MNAPMEISPEDLAMLPDEVREVMEAPGRARADQLQALATEVARLRAEAVAYRVESGIEETWRKCEEAYLGIDDRNRAEFSRMRWAKPMTMEGSLVRIDNKADPTKATAFVRLTSRYVDAGTAKVCEIALPMDGRPFTLKATPVPELAAAIEDKTPAAQVTGSPMPGPDGKEVSVGDLAKHQQSIAESKAEKAAERIYDWMVEYKHNAEMRKLIHDGARLGTGILHGPVPEVRKAMRVSKGKKGVTLEMVKQTKPGARWLDPWCFYPAAGCGEDIHSGGHAFYTDTMLAGELKRLADEDDTFLPGAIELVLEQGPNKQASDGQGPNRDVHKSQYTVWHFFGEIAAEAFKAANPHQADTHLRDAEAKVKAIVTMVNDTVIRAVVQPLESGRLPFHVFNWRRRAGHWAGVGVAEQVDAPQRIVNGATRAMLNNAAISGGSQVVMKRGAVSPADGSMLITPDKAWWLEEDVVDDVRKAFAAFQWPNMTPQLMSVVEYGFKLAEEHSSIPLITQGQSGATTPDTFGGQQLQDNNANQLLREIGFGLNDQVTTPLVDQLYEVLLMDPNISDDEKGDYQVDTSGALAMLEKALQDQFLPVMLQLSTNPAFGLDPERCAEQLLRAKRMVPEHFTLSEEQKKRMAEQPPPKAPAVEAAEIRAKAQVETAKSRDELTAHKIAVDTDRDRQYNESLAARDAATANLRMEELRLRVRLAELEYASKHEISLQEAKTRLADTTMKLQVQRELAGQDGKGPQVATPPVEPAGRAPEGEAYQK